MDRRLTALLAIYTIVVLSIVVILVAKQRQQRVQRRQREQTIETVAETLLRADLRDIRATEAFSVLLNDVDTRYSSAKVERRREIQKNLLGPLVPVDCTSQQRICLSDKNCRLFCKDAAVMEFNCVKGFCVEKKGGDGPTNSSAEAANCDTRNGEFGLLVGYNELGVAQWECVQLFPGWENRRNYCENGTVTLDTRVRDPSYRDCTCPTGTTRMVYDKSVLGQTVYGLPHCVPDHLVKFYSLSYRAI